MFSSALLYSIEIDVLISGVAALFKGISGVLLMKESVLEA